MAKHNFACAFLAAALTVMTALPADAGQGRGGPPPAGRARATRLPATATSCRSARAASRAIVVVSGSGHPARRARVNLSSADAGRGRSTTTDDSGRFAFAQLPEGRYTMSASKQGYIGGTYGQRIPGRAGTPIQLGDGQQMRVQMQIWRGSVITGVVLDEQGEAIPNTPVRVFRYVFAGGQRVLQQSRQRSDRRSRRLSRVRPAARRVPRVRDAAQHGRESCRVAEQARVAVAAALERVAATGSTSTPGCRSRSHSVRRPSRASLPTINPTRAPAMRPSTIRGRRRPRARRRSRSRRAKRSRGSTSPIRWCRWRASRASSRSRRRSCRRTCRSRSSTPALTVPGLNPGGARADATGNFQHQQRAAGTVHAHRARDRWRTAAAPEDLGSAAPDRPGAAACSRRCESRWTVAAVDRRAGGPDAFVGQRRDLGRRAHGVERR